MKFSVVIEPLHPRHDKKGFSCGLEPLDRYLRELAAQDAERRVSYCFIAVGPEREIAGYYTFAAASFPIGELPQDLARRLPRYPLLPAGLIGRLAVADAHKGKALGGTMVMDAALRAARGDPAIFALVVDAKDETAGRFYEHLGFRRFKGRPRSLFMPIATALQAIEAL